jgi:hypothetical protein
MDPVALMEKLRERYPGVYMSIEHQIVVRTSVTPNVIVHYWQFFMSGVGSVGGFQQTKTLEELAAMIDAWEQSGERAAMQEMNRLEEQAKKRRELAAQRTREIVANQRP